MNQAAPAWENGNTIEVYAPNHILMCHNCYGPIPPNTMFEVKQGRPAHTSCPRVRHLRAVT
jgi:hypothetical protein